MQRRFLMTLARYLHPRGAVSFWHNAVSPVRYEYSTLSDYYIDLSAKLKYRGPFDENGIPLLDYFGRIGRQYNPCAIAQWGLGAWQSWQRGAPEAERIFWQAVIWLRKNLEVDEKGHGCWWYRFDFDAYGLKSPWASALAQAQGISLLLRAYLMGGNKIDIDRARQACAFMLLPIEEGGVLLESEEKLILEEVVSDRPTAILDGMIFAVLGLQDYCFVVPDDINARTVLKRCYRSLASLLPQYDLGYWSRADLYSQDPPMPASAFYHRLHVAQLSVLADLNGDAIFFEYAKKWEKAAHSTSNRIKAFINKALFKFIHY